LRFGQGLIYESKICNAQRLCEHEVTYHLGNARMDGH
jgi:hypothetical protein